MAQLTMMIGKCCLNVLSSRLIIVMTSLMPSDSFTAKPVLLNTTFRNSSLHTPVARLNAIHSDNAASSANPDDAGGLHIIFLATQACVMLTANIWQEVGLCNGAAGTVHQLLYQADHKNPTCPLLYWWTLTTTLDRHSSVVGPTVCLSLHCHLNGNLMDDDCLVSKYPSNSVTR